VHAHDVEEAGDEGAFTELVVRQDQQLGDLVGRHEQGGQTEPGPDAAR